MGQLEGKQSIWTPFTFLVGKQCRPLDASLRITFAGVSCDLKSCGLKSDDVYMMRFLICISIFITFDSFPKTVQNHVESCYCCYNILVKPISFPWFPCPAFYLIALYITVKSVTLSCEILLLVSFIIVCRYGLSKNRAELNKSFCPCILSQVYRVDTGNPKIAHAILHSAHVERWENWLKKKKKIPTPHWESSFCWGIDCCLKI